jgi:hypothetical protein
MTCRSCGDGLIHCHGTLVRHADGTVECTDEGCPGADLDLHELRLSCEVAQPDCTCIRVLVGTAS